MELQIIDWIVIALAAVSLVTGLVKGFVKMLLTIVGVVAVPIGTVYLMKYPEEWMKGAIEDPAILSVVAAVATFIALALIYALVMKLIVKLFHKSGLGALDRFLGVILGVGVVYLVFAVFTAFVNSTPDTIVPWLKDLLKGPVENSVILSAVYKNNFFGDWLMSVAFGAAV